MQVILAFILFILALFWPKPVPKPAPPVTTTTTTTTTTTAPPPPKVDVTNHQAVLTYSWELLGSYYGTDERITQGNLSCSGIFLSPSGKGEARSIGIGSYFGEVTFHDSYDPNDTWVEPTAGMVSFLENGTAVKGPVWFHDGCAVMKDTGDATVIAGMSSLFGDSYSVGVNVYAGTKQSTGDPLTRAGLADGKTIRVVADVKPTVVGESLPWRAGTQHEGDTEENCIFHVVGKTIEVSFFDDTQYLYRISFTDYTNPSLGGMLTRIG